MNDGFLNISVNYTLFEVLTLINCSLQINIKWFQEIIKNTGSQFS